MLMNRWVEHGVFACLILGAVLCGHTRCLAGLPEPQRAIATITFTVGQEVQDEFIQRLKKFAEARAFATRAAQYGNDKRHYMVEFSRGDVNITVTNPFRDIRYFSLYIYRTGQIPVPSAHLDLLVSDIQGVVKEVEGVTIDGVKKLNE